MSSIEKVLKTEVSDDKKFYRVLALSVDQKLWLNELNLEECAWNGWKEVQPPPLSDGVRLKSRKLKKKKMRRFRKRRAAANEAPAAQEKLEGGKRKVRDSGITKEQLEDLVVRQNLSQGVAAERLGVSQPTIAHKMKKFGIVSPRTVAHWDKKQLLQERMAEHRRIHPGPPAKTLKDMSPEEQKKILSEYR